jgi:hypothetical protein
VFARVLDLGAAFFAHWLGLSGTALEGHLGPAVRAEPRLVSLDTAVAAPQAWLAGPLVVGGTQRISVAAEPGLAGLAMAFALGGPTPTPFGDLRLDSSTAFLAAIGFAGGEGRFDTTANIPNDPAFLGLGVALQAFGTTLGSGLRFGNGLVTSVGT